MTPDECRLLIPQYLSEQLSAAERAGFDEALKADGDLRLELAELRDVWEQMGAVPEENPSAALRARFYQRLNALGREKKSSVAAKLFSWKFTLPQLAAALCVFCLGAAAGRIELAKSAPSGEVAQMQRQVQSLRETVALSLLDRQSANSRLEGVSWSNRVERPDEELRAALVHTLNRDPNVNVRLASLDALEKFAGDASVRRELVSSIGQQDSPLVQIALIDAIVHLHDHDAAMQLKKVTADVEMNAAVRERAQWGLQKLGLN